MTTIRLTASRVSLLVVFALLALPQLLRAQDPPAPAPPTVVLVPQSEWETLLKRNPKGVVLDYKKYRDMQLAAAANGRHTPPRGMIAASIDYLATPLFNEQNASPDHVAWEVRAVLDVLQPGDGGWTEWSVRLTPLAIDRVVVQQTKPDGTTVDVPAVAVVKELPARGRGSSGGQQLTVALRGQGRHTLIIGGRAPAGLLPGDTGARRISLATSAYASVATVRLQQAARLDVVTSNVPLRAEENAMLAAFGGRQTFDVVLAPKTDATPDREAQLVGSLSAWHDLRPGSLTSEFIAHVDVAQAPLAQLTLALPAGGTLKDVTAARLRHWQLRSENDQRLLDVAFAEPIADGQSADVRVVLSNDLPPTATQADAAAVILPRVRFASPMRRQQGTMALTVASEWTAVVRPDAGFEETAVPARIAGEATAHGLRAWAYAAWGELPGASVQLAPVPTVVDATVRSLWAIGDLLQEVTAAVDYEVVRGQAWQLSAELPPGFQVSTVTSSLADGTYDWFILSPLGEGRGQRILFDLRLRLAAADGPAPANGRDDAGPVATFTVSLLKQQSLENLGSGGNGADDGRVLAVPVVRPLNARDTRLYQGIAAGKHIAVHVESASLVDRERFSSIELDVLRALQVDHPDLAVALRADSAAAVANAVISPRAARLKATAVVMVSLDEQLTTAIRLEYDVTDAPVVELAFTLPARIGPTGSLEVSMPLLGPEGWELVNCRDRLVVADPADGRRRFAVRLPGRAIGKRVLYLTMREDMADGATLSVPVVAVPGAQFTYGVIGVEAAGGNDLQVAGTTQLQSLDPGDFPIVPHPASDGLHRFQHAFKFFDADWQLQEQSHSRRATSVLPCLATTLSLSTILDASGKELVIAEWQLAWSNVQDVRIELPAGAEVLSVLRNGSDDGRRGWTGIRPTEDPDNARVVVPLAGPWSNGARHTGVRVVYQRDTGTPLGSGREFRPEVAKLWLDTPTRRVPVLQTSWRLYLPPGFRATEMTGDLFNAQMVEEDKRAMNVGIVAGATGDGRSDLGISTEYAHSSAAKRERTLGDNTIVGGFSLADEDGSPMSMFRSTLGRAAEGLATLSPDQKAKYADDSTANTNGNNSPSTNGAYSRGPSAAAPPELPAPPRLSPNTPMPEDRPDVEPGDPTDDPRIVKDATDDHNEDPTNDPSNRDLRPNPSPDPSNTESPYPGSERSPFDLDTAQGEVDRNFDRLRQGDDITGAVRDQKFEADENGPVAGRNFMGGTRNGAGFTRPTGSGMAGTTPQSFARMAFDDMVASLDYASLDEQLRRRGFTSLTLGGNANDLVSVLNNPRGPAACDVTAIGNASDPRARVVVQRQGRGVLERVLWLGLGVLLTALLVLRLRVPSVVLLLAVTAIMGYAPTIVGRQVAPAAYDITFGNWLCSVAVWLVACLALLRRRSGLSDRPFELKLPRLYAYAQAGKKATLLLAAGVVIGVVCGTAGSASAQAPGEAIANGSDVVIAPYDPARPDTLDKIDRVFVSWPQYVKLWNAAFPDQPLGAQAGASAAPPAVVYGSRYELRVNLDGAGHDRRVSVAATARFRVEALATGPVEIPIGLNDAAVTRVTFTPANGAAGPAELQAGANGYTLRLTGPIAGTLELGMMLPGVARVDAGRFVLVTPAFPGNRLVINVPAELRPWVASAGGAGLIEKADNDPGRVTCDAVLGATERVEFGYRPQSAGSGIGDVTYHAVVQQTNAVHRAHTGVSAVCNLSITSGQLTSIALGLPEGFVLRRVAAQKLRSWTLGNAGRTLEVTLHEPVSGDYRIELDGEIASASMPPADPAAPAVKSRVQPVLVNGAWYQHGRIRLRADHDLALAITQTLNLDRPAGAEREYEYVNPGFTLGYEVRLQTTRVQVEAYGMLTASRDERAFGVTLDLGTSGRPLHGFDVEIGATDAAQGAWTVIDVRGDRLKDWREVRENGKRLVRIFLSAPVTGAGTWYLKLANKRPDGLAVDAPFSLPAIRVPGSQQPRFSLGVASAVDLDVRVAGPAGFSEVPAAQFPYWSLDDASMRPRGAWRHPQGQEMPADIRITPVPLSPRVTLTSLAHLRITDDWLSTGYWCRWQIDVAPLDHFVVCIPAWESDFANDDTPASQIGKDIRVFGAGIESATVTLVRVARADGSATLDRWLAISIKLHHKVGITWECSVFPPLHRNNVTDVPVPVIRAAQANGLTKETLREELAITIGHDTTREVVGIRDADKQGLVLIRADQLAWKPAMFSRLAPRLTYRARDPLPTMVCTTVQHQEADIEQATVSTVSIVTVVTPDGELRHQLQADVENRTLAVIALAMPDGHDLWSVRVDGQTVRPVEDPARPGEILIPVPKARQGEAAVQLQVNWVTHAGKRLDELGGTPLTLLSPKFVNVRVVEDTFWTVQTPPTVTATVDFDKSSMPHTVVVGSDPGLDRLDTAVKGLEALNERVIASGNPDHLPERVRAAVMRQLGIWNELSQAVNNTIYADAARLKNGPRAAQARIEDNRARYGALQGRANAAMQTLNRVPGVDQSHLWAKINERNCLEFARAANGTNPLADEQEQFSNQQADQLRKRLEEQAQKAPQLQSDNPTRKRSLEEAQRQQQEAAGGIAQGQALPSEEWARMNNDYNRLSGINEGHEGRKTSGDARYNKEWTAELSGREVRNEVDRNELSLRAENDLVGASVRQSSGARGGAALPTDLPVVEAGAPVRVYQSGAEQVSLTIRLQPAGQRTIATERLGSLLVTLLAIAAIAFGWSRRIRKLAQAHAIGPINPATTLALVGSVLVGATFVGASLVLLGLVIAGGVLLGARLLLARRERRATA
ncbi:MAG: hypothetical protein AB7S36_05020 [Planctomycetota bacterium]